MSMLGEYWSKLNELDEALQELSDFHPQDMSSGFAHSVGSFRKALIEESRKSNVDTKTRLFHILENGGARVESA